VNDKGTPKCRKSHDNEVPRGKVPNVVTRSCEPNHWPIPAPPQNHQRFNPNWVFTDYDFSAFAN